MRKRPLCIFCVLFLAAQAVRALCFGAGAYTSALGQALEQKKEEIGVLLEGTVDTIEEKKSVTAVRLKKNAVSLLNHDYLQNFSQELSQKNQEKILVYLDKEAAEPVKIGNRLRIKGRASAFETARNPGNFDQKAYYKRQRISACVWADESEIVSRKTERVRQYLHILRRNWKRLFTECLGEYYGNAMSAILLGEKSELDIDMKKSYQKNGIGHLLAISGVKTLKLDIPLVPETRINWAFVPLHIAIIYILKLCLDEEIIPRCRFPCSRGYFTKCINWQKKQ